MVKHLTVGSLKAGNSTNDNKQWEKKNVSPDTVKPQLAIEQHGTQYKLNPIQGSTVLEAALNQKINLDFKCKKGTCGRCQIKVLSGGERITSVNKAEQIKLGTKIDKGNRLACQAVFK